MFNIDNEFLMSNAELTSSFNICYSVFDIFKDGNLICPALQQTLYEPCQFTATTGGDCQST
ncbi:hypothetical protein BH09BAC6_BH09BAC6_13480 [soil metagenome]|jgi:hypothetical protein